MKEYEEFDGEGTLTAPVFIVRWNGHEYGTRSMIIRPYELLDTLTRKLGIPASPRRTRSGFESRDSPCRGRPRDRSGCSERQLIGMADRTCLESGPAAGWKCHGGPVWLVRRRMDNDAHGPRPGTGGPCRGHRPARALGAPTASEVGLLPAGDRGGAVPALERGRRRLTTEERAEVVAKRDHLSRIKFSKTCRTRSPSTAP